MVVVSRMCGRSTPEGAIAMPMAAGFNDSAAVSRSRTDRLWCVGAAHGET